MEGGAARRGAAVAAAARGSSHTHLAGPLGRGAVAHLAHPAGHAKVGNGDAAVTRQQTVAGLDVAVNLRREEGAEA